MVALPGPCVAALCPKLSPEERSYFEATESPRAVVVHSLLDELPRSQPFHRVHLSRAIRFSIATIGLEPSRRGAAPARILRAHSPAVCTPRPTSCEASTDSRERPKRSSGGPVSLRYLHTMVRVTDLDASLDFYCNKLGLVELNRYDVAPGRFTLVFLAAPGGESAQVELTHNWDPEEYGGGRNFGHLAYEVDDIYAICQQLMDGGVRIARPPRDGHMAFVRSPDDISIELLQKGDALEPAEPWASMPNVGDW